LSVSVFQQDTLPQLFTKDVGVFPESDFPNQLVLNGI